MAERVFCGAQYGVVRSVSQLDSQPFTQSRGQSVDCWRVSQSVGLSVS